MKEKSCFFTIYMPPQFKWILCTEFSNFLTHNTNLPSFSKKSDAEIYIKYNLFIPLFFLLHLQKSFNSYNLVNPLKLYDVLQKQSFCLYWKLFRVHMITVIIIREKGSTTLRIYINIEYFIILRLNPVLRC